MAVRVEDDVGLDGAPQLFGTVRIEKALLLLSADRLEDLGMAIETIPLLDAEGAGPEFFQDVLHTSEGSGVLQIAQFHGLVDGPATPVYPHHRIAVRSGWGAVAKALGVDVPLRSLDTLQEGCLQPTEFLLVVLEKTEDLGSQKANRRGRGDCVETTTPAALFKAAAWRMRPAVSESRRKAPPEKPECRGWAAHEPSSAQLRSRRMNREQPKRSKGSI
ncbi:hypothetical protein [Cystobacter fuscus]|uniref:hypothetical protein n=1 Tax=Cystobacter fuscus TaxID=43 RepID=UPI0012FE2FD4|nr:hypothetical protein [Cystobacter fuscus]